MYCEKYLNSSEDILDIVPSALMTVLSSESIPLSRSVYSSEILSSFDSYFESTFTAINAGSSSPIKTRQ